LPNTPFDIISHYHSSVVMNAIGWEGIFVACPEFTFNDIVLRRLGHDTNDKFINKYTCHGWHEIEWMVVLFTWKRYRA
jgi:hypothetical protein